MMLCSLNTFELENVIHTFLSIEHQELASAFMSTQVLCGLCVKSVMLLGKISAYVLLHWSTLDSSSQNGSRLFKRFRRSRQLLTNFQLCCLEQKYDARYVLLQIGSFQCLEILV